MILTEEEARKKLRKFESIGNDLFFSEECCSCPNRLFIGSNIEHLMKERIRLTGYNDAYFFDVVNKEPRRLTCDGCGRTFEYQWFREGISFKEILP